MRIALPLLFLLLICQLLTAPALSPDEIAQARLALAFDPLNDAKRLHLAFSLMLADEYSQALQEYRFVARRDSTSLDAAAGILWALNSLGDHKQALREANAFLERMPDTAPLFYHRGTARLKLGKANLARLDQRRAIINAQDPFWQGLAAQALSDAYLTLDDWPSAKATLREHAPQATKPKAPRYLSIDASWGRKGSDTQVLTAGLKAGLGSTRLGFRAEELSIDSEHFRWYLHASLLRQFLGFDLQAEAMFLDGNDEKIYPAQGAGLSISPRIYAGPLVLRPRLGQSALETARLNAYQSDLGLEVNYSPFSLGYNFSRLYLDADAVGSDSTAVVHNADASLALGKGWEFGIYAGTGSMAFYSTPYGGFIDAFDPAASYAGLSIYAPLGKHLALLIYGQLSFDPEGNTAFYYLRGIYRV